MLFSGVRLEACEVVEEAQRRGVELSGGRGDDRHEPVVLSLKPVVVLGHLGAVGPVGRVLVAGVLGAPPADRMHDGEVKRQAGGARRGGWVQQRSIVPGGCRHGDEGVRLFAPCRRLVRQAMSCGGDDFHTGDVGRCVGEEALPDLMAPHERGPFRTNL